MSITATKPETKRTLSRRSNIPPCPGRMLEKSLMPYPLLMAENVKSPRLANIGIKAEMSKIQYQ